MPILNRNVACLLLAAALVACDSDAKPAKELDAGAEDEPKPEPGEEDEPDAATTNESDAGTPSSAVPLTVWVDDLIEHRTTDDAEPDTVDDKVIRDDTDESSFDKYLP